MRTLSLRPFLLGLAALALAGLGQRALRLDAFFDAAWLYGLAVALWLVASWPRMCFPEAPFAVSRRALPGWRSRRTWLAAGLTVAAVGLAALALMRFDAEQLDAALAWRQHIASVLLLLLAVLVVDDRPWRNSLSAPALRREWRQAAPAAGLLALIVLAAALFRLFQLDALPFGTWYDEAEYGLQALRILENADFRPIFEGAINGPAHYLYLVAAAFETFGVSTASIRLVNALFGVASVLAGYVVARELFGRGMGLTFALLLAVSSWSITLSRFGMHSTSTTPFFALATVAFLLRGLRRGQLIEFGMAGLWLGLGLCFYTSFRLFVPAVILFVAVVMLYTWWQTRRMPPARLWLGAGVMLLVTLLVVAPVILYAYRFPDIFWARVQDTFIFAGKSDAERWASLWNNVRKHLLMFNWHGDPNGRHNLPGAPMLDDISAALMVLGLAYSLRRACDPRYLLLPVWLLAALFGGILSLDFEAPQSLRANGTQPVAYLLAVAPLAVMGRIWQLSGGRYFPRAMVWPLAGLLLFVGAANLHTYFVRQAGDFAAWNAHSTPETLTAQLLHELDDHTDAFVTAFFHGHPTLKFLGATDQPFRRLETTDQLPLDFTPGRGALLVMNPDSHALYYRAQKIYPNAVYATIMPPMDGAPVLYTVRLSPEDIANVQGLHASYYANATWEGPPTLERREQLLDVAWLESAPLPPPFSVEWNGILHVASYGNHDFFLHSPGPAELYIGEQQVLGGTGALSGALSLAEGNHSLRVRAAVPAEADGAFTLQWRPVDGELAVLGPGALYSAPMTSSGLLARYYANGAWAGNPLLARIEDQLGYYVHVPTLPRPYTVEYTGKIAIPEPGAYRFGVESIDESTIWIDGQAIAHAAEPNVYVEGGIELGAGLHDIRIRFADRTGHTHLNVYWGPPGGSRQILPPEILVPPQADYIRVRIPMLADVVTASGPAQAPVTPAPLNTGQAAVVASGLRTPRGIAIGPDGTVYVAQSESGKVAVLGPDGKAAGLLPSGAELFGEASDVAVDYSTGTLYVLDAAAGVVRRFAADRTALDPFPVDSHYADRARGIAVGGDGRVWIASTPAAQIVAVRPEDGEHTPMPVWTGADRHAAQPVDVAIGADSRIFVADAGSLRLVRLAPDGSRERAWELPPANTLDSPHLATSPAGAIYMTSPEAGSVVELDAAGEAVGRWDLAAMLGRPVKAVGIAVAPDGRIWVTDSDGGNVIVLAPE